MGDLSKYFEISSYTIIYRGRRFEVRKHHGFPSNSFFPVIFRRGCMCDGKANLIFSVDHLNFTDDFVSVKLCLRLAGVWF